MLITSPEQQLAKANTLTDVMAAADAEMKVNRAYKYDDSIADSDISVQINPLIHPDSAEYKDALWWAKYLDHDIILLHGAIRQGKSAIGNKFLKLANWWYNKRVFVDYRPRVQFDLQILPQYVDLSTKMPHGFIPIKHSDYVFFDKRMFVNELAKMGDASLGELANDATPELEKIEKKKADEVRRYSNEWVSQYGVVLLHRAIVGMDEAKRYHNKWRQNDPMSVLLRTTYDQLGHMHCAILAMSAQYDDLDADGFLPRVTLEIKCHKSEINSHVVLGDVSQVYWVGEAKNRVLKHVKPMLGGKAREKVVEDIRQPWSLLGGTIAYLTEMGETTLENLDGNSENADIVKLHKIMFAINQLERASIFYLVIQTGYRLEDIVSTIMIYNALIILDYACAKLVENVDEGKYNSIKEARFSDIIRIDDTTGFRDEDGVGWLEKECIGYGIRTDADGYSYKDYRRSTRYFDDGGKPTTKDTGKPLSNALFPIVRRRNWRINGCEPSAHKAGAMIYTALGSGDTYNSWGSYGMPIPKSIMKEIAQGG